MSSRREDLPEVVTVFGGGSAVRFEEVHARGAKPGWEIEIIPEIGAPDYRLVARRVTPMRGHVQDLAENGVDLTHFRSLHKWSAKSIDWQIDGPTYTMA